MISENTLKSQSLYPGPTAVAAHSAGIYNNKMFVFGGKTHAARTQVRIIFISIPFLIPSLILQKISISFFIFIPILLITVILQRNMLQDLVVLDLDTKQWSSVKDAGERPSPSPFHRSIQIGQFFVLYGGRYNDNSHSDRLHVLGEFPFKFYYKQYTASSFIRGS